MASISLNTEIPASILRRKAALSGVKKYFIGLKMREIGHDIEAWQIKRGSKVRPEVTTSN